eukprot:jgi/Tetstr1/454229/TSEL_041148.t1
MTGGLVRPLKQLCAEALFRSVFFLRPDEPRDVFLDYLSVPWKDGSTLDEWAALMMETGVYHGAAEAGDALARLCREAEPRYPWCFALREQPWHLLAWEVWCFCVARWVRENDLASVSHLPSTPPLDHRHAYAVTGPSSAARPDVLHAYIDSRRPGALPQDWLCLLVRPEMWRRDVFTAWVTRSRWPPHTEARLLTSAVRTAAAHDNLAAIGAVLDLADRDPDMRERFWTRVEIEDAHREIIGAYRRGAESRSRGPPPKIA